MHSSVTGDSGIYAYLCHGGCVSPPCWFVCYIKVTGRIFTKLGGRRQNGSGKITLDFGVDPDQGADPGTVSLIVLDFWSDV